MTAVLRVNPQEAGPVRRTERHLLRHPEQGAAGVPLWAATNGADREKTIMQVIPLFFVSGNSSADIEHLNRKK